MLEKLHVQKDKKKFEFAPTSIFFRKRRKRYPYELVSSFVCCKNLYQNDVKDNYTPLIIILHLQKRYCKTRKQ